MTVLEANLLFSGLPVHVGMLVLDIRFRSTASLVVNFIMINIGYLESTKHVMNPIYSLVSRCYREALRFEIAYGKGE